MAGRFYYDRKKKVPVVCLAGCAVVSVFGSGEYDWKKKLQSSVWRVVLLCQFLVLAIKKDIITTGKKRYSHLSGGCTIMSVILVAIIIFVLVQLELNLIQIC